VIPTYFPRLYFLAGVDSAMKGKLPSLSTCYPNSTGFPDRVIPTAQGLWKRGFEFINNLLQVRMIAGKGTSEMDDSR